jgi:hypothetical protein
LHAKGASRLFHHRFRLSLIAVMAVITVFMAWKTKDMK